MKRLIMCAVMSVGAALAGMFGVGGYIEADVVTGVQSQQLAQVVADFAVEPLLRIQGDVDGTNYVDAVRAEFYTTNAASQAKIVVLQEGTNGWNAAAALAATALQPDDAAGLTVAEARRLVAADSNSWTSVEGGTNWLYTVSNDISRVYIKAASAGFDGPPVGTTLSFTQFTDPVSVYAGVWGAEWDLLAEVGGGLARLSANNPATLETREWSGPDDLPAPLTGVGADNACTLDYIPVTNRTALATQVGTVIMLTDHDEDLAAHPTLPRSNDVVNIVGAATNPLLSKVEAAATYLPLANIPGPGCTDISASGVISGATYNYLVSSTTNWTLSVSASAPRYNYHVRVLSTNNVVFSDMVLFGSYDQGYTNSIVVGPYTGDDWQAQGGTVQ